ncbi:hypothetical protein C9374_000630 [Naegleria lovaniensis]|uniref:Uncharacterized protein n=1 Tax=Naegleria lovaniensis TaxID=51637 RepID=A0AA88KPB3_NAELO|nr:uncharacterized protein C9374_000630 [Naegleria lovaniensis]KAG2388466.1 hypothetical protein C9374_000630 [Naegleria lovaniensis]
MDIPSANKICVVTGAAGGIGSEICKRLIAAGCEVIGVDCNSFRLQELATDLNTYSSTRFHSVAMDLSRDESVKKGVELIQDILNKSRRDDDFSNDCHLQTSPAQQRKIFALINNAAVPTTSPLMTSVAEERPDRLQEMMNINVGGYHRMVHYLLPHMVINGVANSLSGENTESKDVKSGRGGIIINVSSGAGVLAGPFLGFYPITKFAIQGFTDVLRRELSHLGLRVCCVIPGFTKKGMTFSQNIDEASLLRDSMKHMQQSMNSKLEWMGQEPSDVARVVVDNCFSSNCGARVFADQWMMRFVWPLLLTVQIMCPSLVDRMFL